MTSLVDEVLALHDAFSTAGIDHAFGGALSLAFHVAEPRATRDIDVNVFLPPNEVEVVFNALPPEVRWTANDIAEVRDRGQVRLFFADDTPVDLFFSTHRFHDQAASGASTVPLAGTMIPILGASELAVFKAFFDRTRDWADIEAMLAVDTVDVPMVLGWLVELLGPEDHRITRLRRLPRGQPPGPSDPRFDP